VLVELAEVTPLRFEDGSPVRAASAVARYGDGLLVVQDDSTQACWLRGSVGSPLRLLPPVEGHDQFAEALGTKHLKPDLEAAAETEDGGVLLLGSGSTPARMRAVRVSADPSATHAVADLTVLYARIAELLGVVPDQLNLEGACVVGDVLRWFQRGLPSAGVPTASVDLDLATLLAVTSGAGGLDAVDVGEVRGYDLGEVGGVGLAVTDAVPVGSGSDQQVLVSAAAEDSPNAYDDGPVVASALAILDGDTVVELATLPLVEGRVAKVEGLTVLDWDDAGGRLLASVDADDTEVPSSMLTLQVTL
jgi:hypothetical protein